MHRDLKLQNILLTEKSEETILKLADFGLAKRQETKEDLFNTICGTPIYMAPELQKQQKYTEKADLWSLGVILFELIAGFPPFIASTRDGLKKVIEVGKITFPPDLKVSPACLNLI
jgi:serine/threonine-protein kinase ULK2